MDRVGPIISRMREPISRDARLALDLALTIRHDGSGGVADDLTDPAGLTAWVRAHPEALSAGAHNRPDDQGAAPHPDDSDRHAAGFTADAAQLTAVRALRAAVRALFARAVHPDEPSPADAARLMPLPEAVRHLNEAAARTPTMPALDWPEGAVPVVHRRPVDAGDDLTAALAHAVIAFLASPDRDRLRACHAPRCVRYFLKEHPRQEWCEPSCGNRARVARHHQRHKATARTGRDPPEWSDTTSGTGRQPGHPVRRPPRTSQAGARTMGDMSFLRRRSATPAGPDFDVLAMDPGDWPGNLGAGLLPAPDGTCQGVFLRYDLFGGRGPAMIIGNLPEGSPAREVPEGEVPFEVAQLLLALENDEEVTVVSTEDVPVMQGDNLLIVRRVKLSESRISCVQFDRSDNVLVTIAAWDRPITDDLYALLKPLPAELFQQG